MSYEPSEHLARAFSGRITGAVLWCQCGIIYIYTADESLFEPGEIDHWLEREKKDPRFFVVSEAYAGNGYIVIDGNSYVHGCPCSAEPLERMEAFLWSHRTQIADYLKTRAAEMKREAEAIAGPLEGIEL